jgi:hypothetical protein
MQREAVVQQYHGDWLASELCRWRATTGRTNPAAAPNCSVQAPGTPPRCSNQLKSAGSAWGGAMGGMVACPKTQVKTPVMLEIWKRAFRGPGWGPVKLHNPPAPTLPPPTPLIQPYTRVPAHYCMTGTRDWVRGAGREGVAWTRVPPPATHLHLKQDLDAFQGCHSCLGESARASPRQ